MRCPKCDSRHVDGEYAKVCHSCKYLWFVPVTPEDVNQTESFPGRVVTHDYLTLDGLEAKR